MRARGAMSGLIVTAATGTPVHAATAVLAERGFDRRRRPA
jgi:hypothetical protein